MAKTPLKEIVLSKIGIVRTILNGCKNELPSSNHNLEDMDELTSLLHRLTYLDYHTIKYCMSTLKHRNSFQSCLKNANHHIPSIKFELIRGILFKSYVEDQTIPTKALILHNILKYVPDYNGDNLNLDLKANKFLLKKLDNSLTALIVEDPKQIYTRMKYLNKIKNFRHVGKRFVYIIHRYEKFSLAVSPSHGILCFHSYLCSNKLSESESKVTRALIFIEKLIPYMSKNSVVVIDSQDLVDSNTTLNQYSSKEQMKKWLNKHDIPFEENTNTAELYNLIQKYSKLYHKTCYVSDLLKNHGFQVLLVPTEMESLSYFNQCSSFINVISQMTEEGFKDSYFYKNYGIINFNGMEQTLLLEEIRIYNEELELEKTIDMIRVTATRKRLMRISPISCELYERDKDFNPPYIILD